MLLKNACGIVFIPPRLQGFSYIFKGHDNRICFQTRPETHENVTELKMILFFYSDTVRKMKKN